MFAIKSIRTLTTSRLVSDKTLFVRNIAWSVTESDLSSVFAEHGPVLSARIITDRETGRSRGFAFVEMEDAAALSAAKALDGFEMGGRCIAVAESDPNARRSSGERTFGGAR